MFSLILILLATSLLSVALLVERKQRFFAISLNLAQWATYLVILSIVGEAFPFAGGGDDNLYYQLASETRSFQDALDIGRFDGIIEQPGYPAILGLASLFVGDDLFALKLVNLCGVIVVTNAYIRIGSELGGPTFARIVGCFLALLSPLWYYYFFLLKDIHIVLLQSLALLGAIHLFKTRGRRGWLLVAGATILIIPFRSFLAVMSVAVAGMAVAFASIATTKRGVASRSLTVLVGSLGLVLGLFFIITNPTIATYFGISTETRIISVETISAAAAMYRDTTTASLLTRTVLFPVIYFVSETSGLQVIFAGAEVDGINIRGLLALPWLFFYLPFLGFGAYTLIFRQPLARLISSPWIVLLGFCIAYLGISWIVGDTTRWRLPDMPALATVAALGFVKLRANSVWLIVLVLWGAALAGGYVFLFVR